MTSKMGAALLLALMLPGAVVGAAPARAEASGGDLFKHYCAVCHSTVAGENKLGPSLAGIVGRPSATAPDFEYSDAMKNAHVTWNAATLEHYLTNPKSVVPGTKMMFMGIKSTKEREALIHYLASLTP